MNDSSKQQGFTLIEVLIALAVVSIAFFALSHTTQTSVNHHSSVKDRLMAGWVAGNYVNSAFIPTNLPLSKSFLGRDFDVAVSQNQSMVDGFSQMDYQVTIESGLQPVATIHTVMPDLPK